MSIATLNQGIVLIYTASDTTDFNARDLSVIYRKPSGLGGEVEAGNITLGTNTITLDLPVDFLDEPSLYRKVLNQPEENGERIDWKFEILDNATKQTWTMFELQVIEPLDFNEENT